MQSELKINYKVLIHHCCEIGLQKSLNYKQKLSYMILKTHLNSQTIRGQNIRLKGSIMNKLFQTRKI